MLFSSRAQGVSLALGRQDPLEKIGWLSTLVGRIADEGPVIGPGLGCSVHASSSQMYGDPEVFPTPESYEGRVDPLGPSPIPT